MLWKVREITYKFTDTNNKLRFFYFSVDFYETTTFFTCFLFQVNSTWQVDVCTSCECTSKANLESGCYNHVCSTTECVTSCPACYKYMPIAGQCCGECVQTGCHVTNSEGESRCADVRFLNFLIITFWNITIFIYIFCLLDFVFFFNRKLTNLHSQKCTLMKVLLTIANDYYLKIRCFCCIEKRFDN